MFFSTPSSKQQVVVRFECVATFVQQLVDRSSTESLCREAAQQHVVTIFKAQPVLRRLGIEAAPRKRVSADNDAGAVRSEHGQVG